MIRRPARGYLREWTPSAFLATSPLLAGGQAQASRCRNHMDGCCSRPCQGEGHGVGGGSTGQDVVDQEQCLSLGEAAMGAGESIPEIHSTLSSGEHALFGSCASPPQNSSNRNPKDARQGFGKQFGTVGATQDAPTPMLGSGNHGSDARR